MDFLYLMTDFAVLTCLNSSSPSGLKCQSTVARAETSSLILQEMQPSRNPSPATASVRESTSAQPPWHWDTAGGNRGRGREEEEDRSRKVRQKTKHNMQEYYYGNNFFLYHLDVISLDREICLSQGRFICKAPFNKSKCLIKDNTM